MSNTKTPSFRCFPFALAVDSWFQVERYAMLDPRRGRDLYTSDSPEAAKANLVQDHLTHARNTGAFPDGLSFWL